MGFPKLTIITVVRNNLAGLESTFTSLLPLLKGDLHWEHLIIDASPEVHRAWLDSWQSKYASYPLRQIAQLPKGVYPAMNEGISQSSGDVLWFLHAGDALHDRETLERACARMQAEEPRIVCAGTRLLRKNIFTYGLRAPDTLWDGVYGRNRFCQQAMLYRREIFRKLGQFSPEYQLASDYDFHLRAALANMPYTAVRGWLVDYDREGLSANTGQVLQEIQQIHFRHRERLSAATVMSFKFFHAQEKMRIQVFERLQKNRFAGLMRRVWYFWKGTGGGA